jgi:hypothetical protein
MGSRYIRRECGCESDRRSGAILTYCDALAKKVYAASDAGEPSAEIIRTHLLAAA